MVAGDMESGRGREMALSESLIRDLAAQRGEPFVTSIYIDVDGRHYPRSSDLEAHIQELFRAARTQAAAFGDDASEAEEADLAAIEDWLAKGLDRSHTRGVAAFACSREGLLRTIPLPVAVADGVRLDPQPQVGPLVLALRLAKACLVVLVDRERARFLRLGGGEVIERSGPLDGVSRRVDTDVELGSFSRHHEELLRRHIRTVAAELVRELRTLPGACLIVGGPEASDLASELAGKGTPVVGELKVAMTASAHEVDQMVEVFLADLERRREAVLLDDLAERKGIDAVIGAEPTLDALAAGRVETLVVERGFASPGGRCQRCGFLSLQGEGSCSRCGGTLESLADLVEAAISDTLVNGGEVELVELALRGGLGAFERY